MIRSFVGYSDAGIDKAVSNAHKDYDAFVRKYIFLEVKQVWTTSTVVEGGVSIDHWFVLTVLFDGSMVELEGKQCQ